MTSQVSEGKLITECVRCGAYGSMTDAETLEWMKQHGPGKCEEKKR